MLVGLFFLHFLRPTISVLLLQGKCKFHRVNIELVPKYVDRVGMNLTLLDYYFPFFVFIYGIILIFVIENPILKKIGLEKMPDAYQRLLAHRSLGWISFYVGGIWSLQNLLS